jgi:2-dehydropantoate 2-reductase
MKLRFVIVGVGAVGGTVAALLHRAGHDVVGVARGAHLAAIQEHGLTLATPRETFTARLPVAGSLAQVTPGPGDVVVLAMKTQDTAPILDDALRAGFEGAPIVCLQNGLENERLALRAFANVYGVCVVLPSAHDTPGLVEDYGDPYPGILDIGRWPSGRDASSDAIAEALRAAGFKSESVADIQRLKAGKLLMNLGNAIELACGPGPHWGELYGRTRAEAESVLGAAGIAFVAASEDAQRRAGFKIAPIAGKARTGGSTWQSVARGLSTVETDYLNGEIALLARLHGVAAPLNARLAAIARQIALGRAKPGSFTPGDIGRQGVSP